MKKQRKRRPTVPPPRASKATREFAAKEKTLAGRRRKLPKGWTLTGKRPRLSVE